ncbi:MAG: 16S rRNA (guanine(527)-N(7))-methyltransferase RsmG [Bacteroidales bacterium]|nr:16S rRNA (guanine(527)-N(7))-methyltransferase RsmG [Bacteroidales bacterium]
MHYILKYFNDLTEDQLTKLKNYADLLCEWNTLINLISRKDIKNIFLHHILHSISLLKFFTFKPNTSILDVGTGGGLPGIPLSILCPTNNFLLIDCVEKKTKVVQDIIKKINLNNVNVIHQNVKLYKGKHDYIIQRAVMSFKEFILFTKKNSHNETCFIAYKGGDITQEIKGYENKLEIFNIHDIIKEPYFKDKKIIVFKK